ncbi:hypothetical protein BLNAU_19967 [Blattamonas nauphoetae]|uniref:Uncharacterized protein n=1 Tax=Blattamonas nauphoetae TaxID=2049346 RepID=A0ABQ9X0L5_9EUKA|nr:hypothetical protein BLNAU_19967 [Blattamonas nauphoetae]
MIHPEKTDAPTAHSKSITVVGNGLHLESKHLVAGTGPLFSFGLTEQDFSLFGIDSALTVEASLLQSTLMNMTSSSPFSPSKEQFGSEVCQRVVGSCVQKCTNHDSGTGMMSPNLGGNVMCLNTSFSSCIRERNTPLGFSLENRTQVHIGRFMIDSTSTLTSVTFTLCTFNEMTISVSGGTVGGAAILLFKSSSTLQVESCFFHKCTCTANGLNGGAVNLYYTSYDYASSVINSSFTECSAGATAGSLHFFNSLSATVQNCFFEQSSAMTGGTIHFAGQTAECVNCTFVACTATMKSGALFYSSLLHLSLSSVRFRECSSSTQENGQDIHFDRTSQSSVAQFPIQFCDSTSGADNVYLALGKITDNDLVPQLDVSSSILAVDLSFEETQATVTIYTDKAVDGTMGVVLDGSNVPRLVHVVFGSETDSSRIGMGVIPSGANGVLPKATYTLRAAAVTGSALVNSVGPLAFEASSTLKGWDDTEIVLRGVSLKEGSYWMMVENGGKEWNVTLTHYNSTTLTGIAPLCPAATEGRLEWATKFEVMKVIWLPKETNSEKEVALFDTITFTTPDPPPRITKITPPSEVRSSTFVLSVSGEYLPSGETFTVTLTSGHTFEISFSSTIAGTSTVLIGRLSLRSSHTQLGSSPSL